jgi:hypothetical protein
MQSRSIAVESVRLCESGPCPPNFGVNGLEAAELGDVAIERCEERRLRA